MSVLHFLYDVFANSFDRTYREWRADQDELRQEETARQAEEERLERQRREHSRQKDALREQEKAIKEEQGAVLRAHEIESEKQRLEGLRQGVSEDLERLSRLRRYEAECESLKRQIRDKKAGIGQNLDLDELRKKLANAETIVKEERERQRLARMPPPPVPAPLPAAPAPGAPEPTATLHVSEKQMRSMTLRAFKRLATMPQWEQDAELTALQDEMEAQYGPLVAEELVQEVREMLDD